MRPLRSRATSVLASTVTSKPTSDLLEVTAEAEPEVSLEVLGSAACGTSQPFRVTNGFMPKTPHSLDSFQQSIRLPSALVGQVMNELKEHGGFSSYVRQLFEDAATFFDLPRNQVERLNAEAKRLSMNRRKYIQYVLSLHAEALTSIEDKSSIRARVLNSSRKPSR